MLNTKITRMATARQSTPRTNYYIRCFNQKIAFHLKNNNNNNNNNG